MMKFNCYAYRWFCWWWFLSVLLSLSFTTRPTDARLSVLLNGEDNSSSSLFKHNKLLDYDPNDPHIINNEIIVVFDKQYNMMENDNNNDNKKKTNIRSRIQDIMIQSQCGDNGEIINVFEHVLQGAVIRFSSTNRFDLFLNSKLIKYASMNTRVSVASTTTTNQVGAIWNLDRLDQSSLPLDDLYSYHFNGTGVTAYIMDTGIRISHSEFDGGRATCGYNVFTSSAGIDCDDRDGHGTHIAGTIGGKTYGVAKNVNLVAVKVIGDDGSAKASDVIEGFEYVLKQKNLFPTTPMVVNLSLIGRKDKPTNDAVNRLVKAGVIVVSAAGNQRLNACFFSPASAELTITVGATDADDHVSSYSNIGRCVDVFAPGTGIVSASNVDDTSEYTRSGTSMASPHVAGVVALYLEKNPSMTPAQIKIQIKTDALKNRILGLQSAGLGGILLQFFQSVLLKRQSPNQLLNIKNI